MQVQRGQARPLAHAEGLSAVDQEAGWIYSCVTAAATDLELDVEDLGALADIEVKTLPARIAALDGPAPYVLRLHLRLPPSSRFRYLAGQYINLIGAGGVRRSYSIANAPAEGAPLELHVRRVPGGQLSRYWFEQAAVNDLLRFEGPHGSFYLRDVRGQDLILLATGTGIAPIKALLEELQRRPQAERPRSVRLLWGGRVPADLYWSPPDYGFALAYIPVLSRADEAWTGARGHVQDVLLATEPELANAAVYACGSMAMIDSARAACVAAGLPARRFLSDAFVSA